VGVLRLNVVMASKPQYGKDRLVNKRTGKLASSSTWLLDLAACAVVLGDSVGIPALLPQRKAAKLLKSNLLKQFKKHAPIKSDTAMSSNHAESRKAAEQSIPALAVIYQKLVIVPNPSKKVTRDSFVYWLRNQLENRSSKLNQILSQTPSLVGIHELQRSHRWWIDRIKMQSK
jgi:hypothetical protein